MLKKISIFKIFFADLKRLEKFLKNKYGKFLGYGECVNCGDNFWWKAPFKPNFYDCNNLAIKLLSSIFSYGLLICEKCEEKHSRLNPLMVWNNLFKKGWNSETAKRIQGIIEKLKEVLEKKDEQNLDLRKDQELVLEMANNILRNEK